MATITSLTFQIFSRYDGGGLRQARRDIDDFDSSTNRSTNSLNSWSGRIALATQGAVAFGPALIPIGAGAIAAGAGLLSLGAAAGAGLGAYGLGVKAAITSTQGFGGETKKLGDQLTQHKALLATLTPGTAAYAAEQKKVSQLTSEYNTALGKLNPSQRAFVEAQNNMKTAWVDFGTSISSSVLPAITKVMDVMPEGLRKIEPLIRSLSPLALEVANAIAKWVSGSGMTNFIQLLTANARPALETMLRIAEDVGRVLMDGFRAFLPVGQQVLTAIREGADALARWADGGGFQRFLDYVSQNAPAIKDFFSALGGALKNVGSAMAGLASPSLIVTTALLNLVAAMPPGVIQAIAVGFVAIRTAMEGIAIYEGLTAAFAAGSTAAAIATGIWDLAQTALLATMIAFDVAVAPAIAIMALIVLGIAAIGFAIYELVANWSTVWNALKVAATTVWDALKVAWAATVAALSTAWNAVSGAMTAAWNATWNGLKAAGEAVWNALKAAWSAVASGFATAWTTTASAITAAWNTTWNGLRTAAEAVWNAMKAAWQAVATAFTTAWTATSSALTAAWSTFWNALKTAAQAVWDAMKTAWQAVATAFTTVWQTVSSALTAAWNTFWNALKTSAQAVWDALKTAWQTFIQGLQQVWQTVSAALTAAWNTFWNALKTSAQTVWNAMKTAWDAFLNAVKTTWTTISNAIKTAWQTFWNLLKTTAQTVWNAMKTAWTTFLNAIKTAWTTVSNAIKAAWSTFWNGLKTAAQAIWDAMKSAWQTFLNGVKSIWDTFSSTVKKLWSDFWNGLGTAAQAAWDKIKSIVTTAVNAVIDVINGIANGIEDIAEKVGLHLWGKNPVPHVGGGGGGGGGGGTAPGGTTPGGGFAKGGIVGGGIGHFEEGGVLPGFSPGHDRIMASLSGGEGILVPEAVAGLGAGFVHAANYHFSNGRGGKPGYGFAEGGIVPKLSGVEAFHRSGPDPGWSFAVGGVLPSEIPAPDPNHPGQTSGTVGQTPGQNAGGAGTSSSAGISGVGIPGVGDLGSMVLGFIGKAAFETAINALLGPLNSFHMGGDVGKIPVEAMKKVAKSAIDWFTKKDAAAKANYESHAVAGAKSVQAWRDLAIQAMKMGGLDPAQIDKFLSLMAAESSGNPNAINTTDINAKNGIPSQGLMQVIPPTFSAYHVAGTSNNILDPLANMAAAANYIAHRYGGNVPGSPYALGTPGALSGLHLVGEQGPELVNFQGGESVTSNTELSKAFRSNRGGGGAVHVEMPIHVAGNLDKRAVEKLDSEVLPKLRILLSKGTGSRLS